MPRISLPAKLESCETAMNFLREHLAEEHGDMLNFMELAVEELMVNVINYAYSQPDQPEAAAKKDEATWGTLELGFRQVSMDDTPYICVWLRDWGLPFDPFLEAPQPDTSLDAEERPIGGLGVYLVKNVSAHHCYSGTDGENTIELYFKVPSGTD